MQTETKSSHTPKMVLPCTPKMFEELTGLKADFALRAINSHDELLQMLKEAQVRIFLEYGNDSLYKKIGIVLDKAEGGKA